MLDWRLQGVNRTNVLYLVQPKIKLNHLKIYIIDMFTIQLVKRINWLPTYLFLIASVL